LDVCLRRLGSPIGEALASRDFAAHLCGVLRASSPILDLKGPLSTLPWCEQVDRKEQEAVASTTAPDAITLKLSTASQGAIQPSAETADLLPALRDLDVIQAVRSVCPGQERHLVAMFLLTFRTDLGQDELSMRVTLLLHLQRDITNFVRERMLQSTWLVGPLWRSSPRSPP